MRIRKRSTVLSWTSCNTGSSCCVGDGDQSVQQRRTSVSSHEAQELLRPAVSMDVQEETGVRSIIVGGGHGIRIHQRRGEKWRQSLLDSGIQAVKEGETVECKWNGFDIRSQRQLDLAKLEGKRGGGIIPREDPSSSCERGIAGHEKEWDSSPKAGGRFEKSTSSRVNRHCTPPPCKKRKRTAAKQDHAGIPHADRNFVIHHPKPKSTPTKINLHVEDQKQIAEGGSNGNNNNNSYVGSQCRRRNGRGWRCPQRTLVGYSLCEHHLGKARLKSINNSGAAPPHPLPPVNRGICKLKELRFLDPSSSCIVDDDDDAQKKKRSLKLIHN